MAANILQWEESLGLESAEVGATVSEEQVEEIIRQLHHVCRANSLEFALHVGAIIIHHFYNGDTATWRARGPKTTSFRRLAEHPDLPLSAGSLYRCVAIFELCGRLRAPSRWRRLGASHLRAVLNVAPESQERLLALANEERWSVQILQERVHDLRVVRSRGGRRPQSRLTRHLTAVDRQLHDCQLEVDRIESDRLEDIERSVELLTRMKANVETLARAVLAKRDELAQARSEP